MAHSWEIKQENSKHTNIPSGFRNYEIGSKDAEPRRGKPLTWYKEHDIPQFDRMITNPNGAVIREKESEYQKNLDNLTGEIPIIKPVK